MTHLSGKLQTKMGVYPVGADEVAILRVSIVVEKHPGNERAKGTISVGQEVRCEAHL